MAKKKRPGVRAAPSVRSGESVASGFSQGTSTRRGLDRGRSARSGASTRSGLSGRSAHNNATTSTASDAKSVRTTGSGEWDDDERPPTRSMRSLMKKAGSVSSGLTGGGSRHQLSHKQKKARPGLAVAPTGISARSGMSGRSAHMQRALSTRSGMSTGSGGRSPVGSEHNANSNDRPMKKQMSTRSIGNKSAHSARSGKSSGNGGGVRQKSNRTLNSNKSGHASTRSGLSRKSNHSRRSAPKPPIHYSDDDMDEDGEYDEFGEYEDGDEYEEDLDNGEEKTIAMPQTEEDIRKGLHTEQVTKGFFRKKVRSIKWYSADIDKVDAGDYEPGQATIQEDDEAEDDNSSSGEYETDSDDDSQEHVIPDVWYIALGRGLLLLEKKGEETTPIKRWLRFLTWLTFVCDATAAIVALVQFSGVQECCGQPILNLGGININWPVVIRYATIFYLILILLEVYPVLRRGFPFNIVNPLIGFMITFALFFDDSYVEALIMWCIETCAVLSEFAVYRVKIRQVNMRAVEIKQLMPKTTKKKESFEDEDEYLKDLHRARRRYYVLKQEQRMDQRLLQYLHVAVYMNIVMSSIVLMLILVIARNGGLCIENFNYPNPFKGDQLARCSFCTGGPEEVCEQYCSPETETYQCYFPYS